jgi:hypothetical protein
MIILGLLRTEACMPHYFFNKNEAPGYFFKQMQRIVISQKKRNCHTISSEKIQSIIISSVKNMHFFSGEIRRRFIFLQQKYGNHAYR